jgi:hypothetical protein
MTDFKRKFSPAIEVEGRIALLTGFHQGYESSSKKYVFYFQASRRRNSVFFNLVD